MLIKFTQEEMYCHKLIYAPEEEKNHYLKTENLAKREIKSKIFKMLSSLHDAKRVLNREYFSREILKKSKRVILIVFII